MFKKGPLIEFMRFLQKEGIYNSFFKNFNDSKNLEWRNDIHGHVLKKWHPADFLSHSFAWTYTTEGHKFWRYMDDKWKKEVASWPYSFIYR